jgi:hypothetical protein
LAPVTPIPAKNRIAPTIAPSLALLTTVSTRNTMMATTMSITAKADLTGRALRFCFEGALFLLGAAGVLPGVRGAAGRRCGSLRRARAPVGAVGGGAAMPPSRKVKQSRSLRSYCRP